MHDVFISYEHESKSIADNICASLENSKIRCWYAPRDVIGDYATSIVEAISNSKVFVLVLNENASKSPHVLNEVELAYKMIMEKKIIIIPFKVDNLTLSMAMEYYVKRLHWIDASNRSLEVAISDLKEKLMGILNIKSIQPIPIVHERMPNKYFFDEDEKEKKRLALQAQLLKDFDQQIYDNIIIGKNNLQVLDIGSNNGRVIIDRIGDKIEVSKIIGLEYEEHSVEYANKEYGSDNIIFYQCDVEAEGFDCFLEKVMKENNIQSFDIINMSMIILHMNRPYTLIKTLRRFLSSDGVLYIRDIDDGINFAYPDPNNDFERVYAICNDNETSGYRRSGRQIYGYLKKCGFRNIRLERSGLNSIGMDFTKKQALFDIYFSFILEDLKVMMDRYPGNEKIMKDYEWYSNIYELLEERFHSEEFLFSLGFMIFTATK